MSKRVLCVVCCAPVAEGRPSLWRWALGGCCLGLPWGPLPLCLIVLLEFLEFLPPMRLRALVGQF